MSSVKKVHYEDYMDLPEIAAVCLSCGRENCNGICIAYKNAVREHLGMGPLTRHWRNRRKGEEDKYGQIYGG